LDCLVDIWAQFRGNAIQVPFGPSVNPPRFCATANTQRPFMAGFEVPTGPSGFWINSFRWSLVTHEMEPVLAALTVCSLDPPPTDDLQRFLKKSPANRRHIGCPCRRLVQAVNLVHDIQTTYFRHTQQRPARNPSARSLEAGVPQSAISGDSCLGDGCEAGKSERD